MKTTQTLTKMETALIKNFEERLTRLETSLAESISSSSTDSTSAAQAVNDLERKLTSLEEKLSPLHSSLIKLFPLLAQAQITCGALSKEVTEQRANYSRLSSQIARLSEVLDA